jgi:hypothetical protein
MQFGSSYNSRYDPSKYKDEGLWLIKSWSKRAS